MPRPDVVYHMLPRIDWEALAEGEAYSCASLAAEGFIHCTGEAGLLVLVANHHYRQEPGEWVIFSVDTKRLTAPLRWEPVGVYEFPHVYGKIDADAIVAVTPFPRAASGEFLMPVLEVATEVGRAS
ncbi:MAG: DUF952 domain-containing protein [Anaerolineales bacterium]|nr:DUF952 domain-containing protein [Anaerolineales bacterium]